MIAVKLTSIIFRQSWAGNIMAVAGISRALTWLQGADFLSPEMADELFADVIRHRIYMNAAARREGVEEARLIAAMKAQAARPVKRSVFERIGKP